MVEKSIRYVKEDLSLINDLIEQTKKSLEDAPEGSLNIKHKNGYAQYYQHFKDKGKNDRYLRKDESNLIQALAQKDYDIALLKVLNENKKSLESFQEHYSRKPFDSVFESLCEERRRLVNPVRLTDGQFIKAWLEEPYFGKGNVPEEKSGFVSANGENVRPKSEMIIADTLSMAGLPYRYEQPLQLGGVTVYPDFTILDIRTRRVRYLEHFGMLDDSEYYEKFTLKMARYEEHGILMGRDLIMTFESSKRPLDRRLLKKKLSNYFGVRW